VQRVLAHDETQTDTEAVAEDEAAREAPDHPPCARLLPLASVKAGRV
jgi:hypothetical protein